jgi:hypothetical protein
MVQASSTSVDGQRVYRWYVRTADGLRFIMWDATADDARTRAESYGHTVTAVDPSDEADLLR